MRTIEPLRHLAVLMAIITPAVAFFPTSSPNETMPALPADGVPLFDQDATSRMEQSFRVEGELLAAFGPNSGYSAASAGDGDFVSSVDGENRGCSTGPLSGGEDTVCSTSSSSSVNCTASGANGACSASGGLGGCTSSGGSNLCSAAAGSNNNCSAGSSAGAPANCSASGGGGCSVYGPGSGGANHNTCSSYNIGAGSNMCSTFGSGSCSVAAGMANVQCTSIFPGGNSMCSAFGGGECSTFGATVTPPNKKGLCNP